MEYGDTFSGYRAACQNLPARIAEDSLQELSAEYRIGKTLFIGNGNQWELFLKAQSEETRSPGAGLSMPIVQRYLFDTATGGARLKDIAG
jgi:hypothetical protein